MEIMEEVMLMSIMTVAAARMTRRHGPQEKPRALNCRMPISNRERIECDSTIKVRHGECHEETNSAGCATFQAPWSSLADDVDMLPGTWTPTLYLVRASCTTAGWITGAELNWGLSEHKCE